MSGKPWTKNELAFLRNHCRQMPTQALAEELERTPKAVGLKKFELGLTRPSPRFSDADKLRMRELAAKGWCNRCIGRDIKHHRKEVRKWRIRLGIPPITARGMTDCPVCKERTRRTTQEQCRKAGVKSLAEIKQLVVAKFAVEHGWPADLPPRCVQILELLAVHGAMKRRDLWEAMGRTWIRSRKAFNGSNKLLGGNYVTHLMHKGLVASLGRPVRSVPVRRGASVALYTLTPLAIEMHKEHHERKQRDAVNHSPEYADAG